MLGSMHVHDRSAGLHIQTCPLMQMLATKKQYWLELVGVKEAVSLVKTKPGPFSQPHGKVDCGVDGSKTQAAVIGFKRK